MKQQPFKKGELLVVLKTQFFQRAMFTKSSGVKIPYQCIVV